MFASQHIMINDEFVGIEIKKFYFLFAEVILKSFYKLISFFPFAVLSRHGLKGFSKIGKIQHKAKCFLSIFCYLFFAYNSHNTIEWYCQSFENQNLKSFL